MALRTPAAPEAQRADVLLVDDDDDVRAVVAEALSQEGFSVREAVHGREALDQLEDEAAALPKVIVLDLMMPVMDGREMLGHLAASERLRAIPVLVATAAPHLVAGLGIAGVVAKPFEMDELVAAIRRLAPGLP